MFLSLSMRRRAAQVAILLALFLAPLHESTTTYYGCDEKEITAR